MIVIKYGGNAIPTSADSDPVLEAIADAFLDGEQLILVHGGGPQIDSALNKKGLGKEKIAGYRITTPEVYSVVESVLSGTVLRSIVNYLIGSEVNAVGLSASDGGLIRVKKFRPVVEDKSVDIGLVGEVIDSNPMILESLITEGYLPVISPIATDHDGVGYNVNADLVAAAIGGAIRADSVIYLTDVDGIYRNWPDKSSIIGEISISELRAIENSFTDGMIPKVKAAINAIESGAFSVRITNGTKLEAVLDALDNQGGTLVVA